MVSMAYTTTTSPTMIAATMAAILLIMEKSIIRATRNNNTESRIPACGSRMFLLFPCCLNLMRTDAMQSAKLIRIITMTQKIGVGGGVAELGCNRTNVPLAKPESSLETWQGGNDVRSQRPGDRFLYISVMSAATIPRKTVAFRENQYTMFNAV